MVACYSAVVVAAASSSAIGTPPNLASCWIAADDAVVAGGIAAAVVVVVVFVLASFHAVEFALTTIAVAAGDTAAKSVVVHHRIDSQHCSRLHWHCSAVAMHHIACSIAMGDRVYSHFADARHVKAWVMFRCHKRLVTL